MSLDSFIGIDNGEGISEAALEALREKMRAAAAQIAAIKKEESKHKKKEEELLKILLQFIKKSSKKELVHLISRCLEENIPANFILAIVLLGNEDIQKEIGAYLMLPGKVDEESAANKEDKALIFFNEKNETMPLKIRIELDHWVKGILFQASERPQKLLKNAYKITMVELPKEYDFEEAKYKEEKSIKVELGNLMAFVLKDFLGQHDIIEDYKKLKEFTKFILDGILNKTQESLDNRQFLEGKVTK